jgi:hypothetical protein
VTRTIASSGEDGHRAHGQAGLAVLQAKDMRSLLREAQGYILSTRRLLDGEPL